MIHSENSDVERGDAVEIELKNNSRTYRRSEKKLKKHGKISSNAMRKMWKFPKDVLRHNRRQHSSILSQSLKYPTQEAAFYLVCIAPSPLTLPAPPLVVVWALRCVYV